MEVPPERFAKIKQEAEVFYHAIGEVYCPYLKDMVAFNTRGLDHIKFKEWDKARSLEDQYVRWRLIGIGPRIIKESHTLQEFFETNKIERQKINSRWESMVVRVTYYGFVAIIDSYRMRVIVKEIEGGQKFFWSLIPFWKTKIDNPADSHKKILHEGDLEAE